MFPFTHPLCILNQTIHVIFISTVFLCKRTRVRLNITARKDSKGFERVSDYFPDTGRAI